MRKCCDGVREPSELCLALRECFRFYLIASGWRIRHPRYRPPLSLSRRVRSDFPRDSDFALESRSLSVFAQTHEAMLADAHRRARPDANGGSIQTHEWPRDVIKEIYQ